jgi:hypothetical protein
MSNDIQHRAFWECPGAYGGIKTDEIMVIPFRCDEPYFKFNRQRPGMINHEIVFTNPYKKYARNN